ncbi:MAG: putative DNA-binding domain-containing protein [Gammaproteobacteria bacterium]|nr:putative DNA-binding domain-containing protein [Gammaproteobacteria bacterium]MDH5591406.1 putative DNA-binding domain-containing protein [Gammaproteobacteria bacterium]
MSHTQPEPQNFIDTQYQFARHIRDPEQNPAPDNIEQRRMQIYRELFYNNIEGFIANAFPVLRKLTSEEVWHSMVRDFMSKHRCQTPLFHEIAREFLIYLEKERDCTNDPIFIRDLAHYEWVELALSVLDTEIEPMQVNPEQDCLTLKLNTSPLAWPLAYSYAVHQIAPDNQPTHANDTATFLLIYRNTQDSVTFIELNPVSARLIDLLNEGLTGKSAAERIALELQHPNPHVVLDGAKTLITDWIQREILIAVQ